MHMRIEEIVGVLRQTPSIVEGLIAAAPPDVLGWREAPGAWNVVEILCHLADGEITDWMPRVERILAGGGPFEPFDREGGFKRYGGRTALDLVGEFGRLRRANVAAVTERKLTAADLARTGIHPEFGKVTLGQLLACWATHDMAHVSQLSRVLTRAFGRDVGPWRAYFSLLKDQQI
jgi:hypothetical protein